MLIGHGSGVRKKKGISARSGAAAEAGRWKRILPRSAETDPTPKKAVERNSCGAVRKKNGAQHRVYAMAV
ncbi:hypothetical protein [Aequorivita echinoideorum]|uniref:Uncharacterized protein n=1 Tax=Aequorivita echinoideorum TaxID=1549647 RepID=A0ABS5S7N6_9FLAO|nr:hypothetical protein [Aequorivita echinoideorum]MBT0609217.1 hypothetical protein [Aequorivita echinoideorum]